MNKLKELGFAGFFSEVLDPDNYYTKFEIIELLSQVETPSYIEVDTLPAVGEPGVIYLIPKQGGGKEQWIYSNGQWIDIGGTDIDLTQYVKKDEIVDMMYPIGSTLIMPTNTDPGTIYSGTSWELYDKGLAYAWNTTAFTFSDLIPQSATKEFVAIVNNDTIEFRIIWDNGLLQGDSAQEVGALDFMELGLSEVRTTYTVSYADALDSALLVRLQNTGTLYIDDWIYHTPHPTQTVGGKAIQFVYKVPYPNMIDEYCDKFYFRRTA